MSTIDLISELKPQLDMVDEFLRMLPKDDLALAIVESKTTAVVPGVMEMDDLVLHTPMKTIEEMIDCRQVEKCIVMCTISAIESDKGWYYLTCKVCSEIVQRMPPLVTGHRHHDDLRKFKFFCAKCKCHDPKLLPRYKLYLVVLDNTGSSKFLLFDNLALQLVHQPCIELTGAVPEQVPLMMPLALLNLIGKTYCFKVEIRKYNAVYKHDTFKVNKIANPFDINQELLNLTCPKVSQMLYGEMSSQPREPSYINLEEEFDHESDTKSGITTRIKKLKLDKSG